MTNEVKSWDTDSTHAFFHKADDRRKSLIDAGVEKDNIKVRKLARGFVVKKWNGQTKAAPKKKAEPTNPPLVAPPPGNLFS